MGFEKGVLYLVEAPDQVRGALGRYRA